MCVSAQAIAWCILVLEEWCNQLHSQIPTEKEELVFVGFLCFVVAQSWQCCSVYASNIEDVQKWKNSLLKWFWLDWVFPHLLIDDVSTSFGVIVKRYDCLLFPSSFVTPKMVLVVASTSTFCLPEDLVFVT